MNVAQLDKPILVQAAGYNRPIHQNSNVRAQAVAAASLAEPGPLHTRPDEFRIEVQIEAILDPNALLASDVHPPQSLKAKAFLNRGEHVSVRRGRASRIVEIPESIVDVKIWSLRKGRLGEAEDPLKVGRGIRIWKIIAEAMQREVHLPKRRMQQQLARPLPQKYPVADQENAHVGCMGQLHQGFQLRVQQGLAHQMQADFLG